MAFSIAPKVIIDPPVFSIGYQTSQAEFEELTKNKANEVATCLIIDQDQPMACKILISAQKEPTEVEQKVDQVAIYSFKDEEKPKSVVNPFISSKVVLDSNEISKKSRAPHEYSVKSTKSKRDCKNQDAFKISKVEGHGYPGIDVRLDHSEKWCSFEDALMIDAEAKRQGYVYNEEFRVNVNKDGDMKTEEEFLDNLESNTIERTQYSQDVSDELNFEDVKSGLKPLMRYKAFIRVLEAKGYQITDKGKLLSPQKKDVYLLEDLKKDWRTQKQETIHKFAEFGFQYDPESKFYIKDHEYFTVDEIYEKKKTLISKRVIDAAKELLQMEYDPARKCFRDGKSEMSVTQMIHEIMMKDFGL